MRMCAAASFRATICLIQLPSGRAGLRLSVLFRRPDRVVSSDNRSEQAAAALERISDKMSEVTVTRPRPGQYPSPKDFVLLAPFRV